jgi:uncharacterized membrane-anchored protein YitT (DUF2179 family)
MQRNRRRTIQIAQAVIIILFGEALNVVAFRILILPAHLLSGGVVGASMLLNQVFNLPIGLQTTLYNIPIFWLGWRFLGRRFVLLSILGVLSFSVLLDNIHLAEITHDVLLSAVFGGVLTGVADGLILRAGGSTGGFDIIGLIVSKRSGISVGQVFLIFNGLIIALAALVNGPELAMYTLIMQFVASRVVDTLQASAPRRVALIISPKNEQIAARIMKDLSRGATYLEGGGAFTHSGFRVLMCVITRYELVELRQILTEIDPSAFSVILEASEVVGRFDLTSPLQRLLG